MKRLAATALCILFATAGAFGDEESPPNHIPSGTQIEDLDNPNGAADTSPAREISALTLDLIEDFEQLILKAYDDGAGYCTIGYGHVIAKGLCKDISLGEFGRPIDEARAEQLLQADTLTARRAVERTLRKNLNDNQFGALVSFTFNVGTTGFQNSTLLALVNKGEYDLAARQFGRWIRAGKFVMNGLIDRRACEAQLFSGTLQLGADGKFDRDTCAVPGIAVDNSQIIDIYEGEK